ncbi:MAG: TlyA family RNA methyltransferase [Dehalococcoidia bacterium]|nr:TlyA family RNA methyltransferase [Dehalococcoidia bacterium]MYA51890.1 TlyA family RNA methyltransferase [Dehalococcoidia bacterium]
MARVRADQLLVHRGLAESRESARRLIMAGRARSGTLTLVKPATMLDEGAPLDLSEVEPYVSRGGRKLEAALDAFGIDPAGLRCLDVGASTGGFTDCLLQRCAASVVAVDVGRGQLHQRLREDPRVTCMERTNARDLPELPLLDFFVADVSFISLRKVLPSVASRLPVRTPGVVLLKPQFEAGPADVPRGGVVRDETIRTRVLDGFRQWALAGGWDVLDSADCAITGDRGNREIVVHLRTPARREPPC